MSKLDLYFAVSGITALVELAIAMMTLRLAIEVDSEVIAWMGGLFGLLIIWTFSWGIKGMHNA